MFIADFKRNCPKADLITVRANEDGLQFCIFKVDKDTDGYKILNEGTVPKGKVLEFIVTKIQESKIKGGHVD